MTLDAASSLSDVLVRSFQLESRTRVVERLHEVPVLCDMAGRAGEMRLRVDLVRIGVARVAGAGRKVKLPSGTHHRDIVECGNFGRTLHPLPALRSGIGSGGSEGPVTLVTVDLGVLPSKRELCLGVTFSGKRRGRKARRRMAHVAHVVVRSEGEFTAVWFDVTFGAAQLAGPVSGLSTLGLMAFRAAQRCVFSHQGKCTSHMGVAVK